MTMHWKPPPVGAPPKAPQPGDWVTITLYCGCGLVADKGTVQVPPDGRLEYRAYGHLRGLDSPCNTREPTAVMQWTHWGPALSRRYERPHP